MSQLEGIPISPGYASGIAVVYGYEIERRLELPHRKISQSDVKSEYDRLDEALEQSDQNWQRVQQSAKSEPGLAASAALLSAHSMVAKEIVALVKQHIGREVVKVEQALDSVIGDIVQRLQRLDSEYFREREQDVRDVGRQLNRHLTGSLNWSAVALPPQSVIVAGELLPSETIELANKGVVAIVCEHGGPFSHTAIVARSLGIPAISGIPNVAAKIDSGTRLLVDGETGRVTVAPSESDEGNFVKTKQEHDRGAAQLAVGEQLPSITRDGIEIKLLANIGRPEELDSVAKHNLVGTGLFRTEFLFLESHERPGFELQRDVYERMTKSIGKQPLVIRTFDLGGDKIPPFLLSDDSETQACLHLRGLRFSLAERRLLDAQVRAIVQVAQTANVRILLPMVVGSDDLARAISVVDRVVDQLGVLRRPPIGAMIETPAALYAIDEIFELADFAAVGTNDLTQYMLAADRDLSVAIDDCTAMHPAVLRAIKQIVEAAEKRQFPICVCGEEAGEPEFACLLIGLGVRELSLSPARAAGVRDALRKIDCQRASEVAGAALGCRTPQQVRKLLREWLSTELEPLPC